jgi:hypothetical protein
LETHALRKAAMNQSLPWSLVASTALALLLMTPVSVQRNGASMTTFGAVVATVQQAIDALTDASDANRSEVPEAGTLSLLIAGGAGAWCVRRRNASRSQ